MVPVAELKLQAYPGDYMVVEGQQCMTSAVGTNKGARLCVLEEAGGRLYELGARSSIPKPEEARSKTSLNLRPLSVVAADTIRKFSRIAEAIDLLLRKSDLDPAAMITARMVNDQVAVWYAVSGNTCSMIATLCDRADLIGSDGEVVLTVTRAEIERHAAEAAAGRDSMRVEV